MVELSGNKGARNFLTRVRKEGASKVKAAPRRACAVSGSGIADNCWRERW